MRGLAIGIGVLLGVTISALGAVVEKRIPIEFRHVGDDGLSKKLADQVENAFKRSPEFLLSSGRKPGTLFVMIPTNVDWKDVGPKTKVLYTVEFSADDNRKIGGRKGSCWEDELPKCAAQIVEHAKIAARNIHGDKHL